MKEEDKMRIALWRLGVLGPLVSARLERGDRANFFKQAAARTYEDHGGRRVKISSSTVEAWYYRWLKGGFDALKPGGRCDAGVSRSIAPGTARLIVDLKRENPRRSIRRIIRMLERAGKARAGELTKSSVHRLLLTHGLSQRPRRHYDTERRAFRHPHAGDLWMGDVMHGPRVIAEEKRVRKSYLHLFLDSATRFVSGACFQLSETAADHEAVLKQAFLKHGLPRVLYLDRGAAQISGSLKLICAELKVRLVHTRPYDPQAKGAVEKLFSIIRAELESELPQDPIELEELNSILWSWVSSEYHRRVHGSTKKAPLDHWLEEVEHLRPAPRPDKLDIIFLHRAIRKVRQDSTVRFKGKLLEVRPELCSHEVELRFDPHNPNKRPLVFVNGEFYCDTVEVDLLRNASRKRHRPKPVKPEPVNTGIDPLKQIQDEHFRRVRPPKSFSKKEK